MKIKRIDKLVLELEPWEVDEIVKEVDYVADNADLLPGDYPLTLTNLANTLKDAMGK